MEAPTVEERLATLEARIRELENAPRRPMKDSLRCPMCGGRTIYHSPEAANHVLMYLTATAGIFSHSTAPCEAHACASCGFTELHAPTGIDVDKTKLKVLNGEDPDESGSPYR